MHVLYKSVYWIFMAAVLTLGGLLMVSLVPIAGNIQIKIVKSGSMEPVIKTGSIVVDKPEASYNMGDVVTFGKDTKTQIPTTHRIVSISGTGASEMITTKGDANDAADPAQTPISAVHGKVIFTVPYLGYILSFARQPMGFALLVGVPAFAIILEEIGKIVREVVALRRRKQMQRRMRYAQTQPQTKRRIIVD